jgi:hypothetical protein
LTVWNHALRSIKNRKLTTRFENTEVIHVTGDIPMKMVAEEIRRG